MLSQDIGSPSVSLGVSSLRTSSKSSCQEATSDPVYEVKTNSDPSIERFDGTRDCFTTT